MRRLLATLADVHSGQDARGELRVRGPAIRGAVQVAIDRWQAAWCR